VLQDGQLYLLTMKIATTRISDCSTGDEFLVTSLRDPIDLGRKFENHTTDDDKTSPRSMRVFHT